MPLKEEWELTMGEGNSKQKEQKVHRQEDMNKHASIRKVSVSTCVAEGDTEKIDGRYAWGKCRFGSYCERSCHKAFSKLCNQ